MRNGDRNSKPPSGKRPAAGRVARGGRGWESSVLCLGVRCGRGSQLGSSMQSSSGSKSGHWGQAGNHFDLLFIGPNGPVLCRTVNAVQPLTCPLDLDAGWPWGHTESRKLVYGWQYCVFMLVSVQPPTHLGPRGTWSLGHH